MKEVRRKVKVGAKEPQVVAEKVYFDGRPDYRQTIAGNNLCRKCGGCCKSGRYAWMEYYSDTQQDYNKAMRLAREHPWFNKMWNTTITARTRFCRRWRRKYGKRPERWWRCDMLEKRKELYSCKIHRLLGFNAKPAVCKNHGCGKLRIAVKEQGENKK